MIGFIRGELAEKGDGYIIVDVNGVGYEIFVPANSRAYLSEEGREVCPRRCVTGLASAVNSRYISRTS